MDLITTHVNADFDALGSLVAAKKLYPDSRLLLPGSQEDAVREFLSLAGEQVVVQKERECRLDDIDRLIVVDTRQKSRIGAAAELIDRGVDTHVYDHHPRMKGDIVADKDVYEEVGATITILIDMIRKRKIRLSYLEATLMLIGIYEETGSLTYRTTTKRDVDTVSFLLSAGASLSAVSSYLNRELGEGELSLLTRMINLTQRKTVKGMSVSIIELERSSYVGELGVLIHKLMEIENIPVLFVLIDTGRNRVDVVGRSNVPSLDVNRVLSHFGGGGHPGAASAKVHDEEMRGVKRRLMDLVKENIKVKTHASDIMSKELRFIDINEKVSNVYRLMLKDKIGALPVVSGCKLSGIITLVGLNKALKAGFGHARVKGYMTRKIIAVGPQTPLYAIRKIIYERQVMVVPVVDRGHIVGVINRTDVLRNVHEGMFLKPHKTRKKVIVNLSKKICSLLPKDVVRLLKKIGRTANSSGYSAFVVGGLVRDLMMGTKNLDLDIVVEGDAIKLGNMLSDILDATIVVHKKFGTCSLYMKNGLKIDMATARKEVYTQPAALPMVEFSSLKDDLIRRDFTINAMAISINADSFGRLIDFFNGERDLARGKIKIMHDGSFLDDPTRIFRAVRFETRLGFVIDGHTEELIKNAIDMSMFDEVQPQRIRDELILILKEDQPLESLKRMAALDELRFIHPDIRLDSDLVRLYESIDTVMGWYDKAPFKKRNVDKWLIYLMALFEDMSYNSASSICTRFVFRRSDRLRILSYKRVCRGLLKKLAVSSDIKSSKIYRLLEPLSFEVILLIMARSALLRSRVDAQRIRDRIKDFLQRLNGTRISIKGDDLKDLGLKPSPRYKTVLNKVLLGKLDGRLKTKQDELWYAKKLIKHGCVRT